MSTLDVVTSESSCRLDRDSSAWNVVMRQSKAPLTRERRFSTSRDFTLAQSRPSQKRSTICTAAVGAPSPPEVGVLATGATFSASNTR
jgi:hypothetical protein